MEKRVVCDSFNAGLKDLKAMATKNASSPTKLTGSFNAGLKVLKAMVEKRGANTTDKKSK